jgi:hypothetical protein
MNKEDKLLKAYNCKLNYIEICRLLPQGGGKGY